VRRAVLTALKHKHTTVMDMMKETVKTEAEDF
jgi:hypothetical protein